MFIKLMEDEINVIPMKLLGPVGNDCVCTIHTVFGTEYVLRWISINNIF